MSNNDDNNLNLLIGDEQDAQISESLHGNNHQQNNGHAQNIHHSAGNHPSNNNYNNNNQYLQVNNSGDGINKNNNNNNNHFNPSKSRYSASDEFANEMMYNSYDVSQPPQGGVMTAQYLAALQQQAAQYSGFIPNNHPSVSPHETNLFVAGLPPGTDDEKLGSYFNKFGKIVSARVLVDLVTHSLRNYGFVKFETREAAEHAIEEMNEYRVTPHQILHVTWATHREDAPECDTLYVRNLPDNVTRQDLTAFFSRWGEVRELSLPRCAPFRGVCFVRYRHVDEAKNALNDAHNSTPFGNRALQVRYKAPSKKMPFPSGMMPVSNAGAMGGAPPPPPPPPPGATIINANGMAHHHHHHHHQHQQQHHHHHHHQQVIMMQAPPQQQQLVQVVGPNGQIQLVPASAVIISNGSGSRNGSSTSHPLGPGPVVTTTANGLPITIAGDQQQQQFFQQQFPPQQQQQAPPPPVNFPRQGDLCFFNVADDQELLRHLTASYGQVSFHRRTPEGALLVRLFNSQQHDFCARQLNGQSIAPGRPALTVGVVGVQ